MGLGLGYRDVVEIRYHSAPRCAGYTAATATTVHVGLLHVYMDDRTTGPSVCRRDRRRRRQVARYAAADAACLSVSRTSNRRMHAHCRRRLDA